MLYCDCFTLQAIHDFVEELDVNDDPEYQVRTDAS